MLGMAHSKTMKLDDFMFLPSTEFETETTFKAVRLYNICWLLSCQLGLRDATTQRKESAGSSLSINAFLVACLAQGLRIWRYSS